MHIIANALCYRLTKFTTKYLFFFGLEKETKYLNEFQITESKVTTIFFSIFGEYVRHEMCVKHSLTEL